MPSEIYSEPRWKYGIILLKNTRQPLKNGISVKKYGWIYRIKDKKRAIIYLSPRTGYFIVSMVFGQKATDKSLDVEISESVKTDLMNSKVYMEGWVLRLRYT